MTTCLEVWVDTELHTVRELAQLGEEGAEDVEGAEAVNPGVVDGDQQKMVDGTTAPVEGAYLTVGLCECRGGKPWLFSRPL